MGQGVSQSGRFQKALERDYFSVDERSMLDLLRFTIQYAERVRYFDFNNQPSNTWRPFFMNDPLFVIAMIAGTDLQPFKTTHDSLLYKLNESNNFQKNELEEALATNILQLANYIKTWNDLLVDSNFSGPLIQEIQNSLKYLNDDLAKVLTKQNKIRAKDLGISDTFLQEKDQDIMLSEAFKSVFKSLLFVKKTAEDRFETELFESQFHHPHIGLLVTFFKLFEEIQKDVNEFTQKHLDFYYKKLLEQKPKKKNPSTAIIGLQSIVKGPENFFIPEGQQVKMVFDNKEEIDFESIYGEWVSQAKISEIRTLFKSFYTPFSDARIEDGTYLNIIYDGLLYDGIPTAKVNLKIKNQDKFPASLGEDQHLKGISERTLWESNIGIAISSPVLIVENGNFKAIISINLSESSLTAFELELNKLRGLKEKLQWEDEIQKKSGNNDLASFVKLFLLDSFRLSYSTPEGWRDLPGFSITFNREEKCIEFVFELSKNEPSTAIYNNEVHGGNFESEWPILKILINKEASLPPYRLLQILEAEEVAIEVQVSGVEQMQISNQLGDLDIGSPFQPFGPLPDVGSKLKVSNPYLISRYLSELIFHFKWSGLPLIRNGFREYYSVYPQRFDDQDFVSEISVQRGKKQVKHHKSFQEFNLFESEEREDGFYLLPTKTVEVDLGSFDVEKGPGLLPEERDKNDLAVIFSLSKPYQAFGHHIYSELFADISMQKSRFKRRKLELPKQPYTPVLEHLLVDYKNYTKENISRGKITKSVNIKLFHIYPFGHVLVYPASLESFSYLMPQIKHKGNLLLGLTDVKANEILNIGFELEEAIYPISAIRSPDLYWEYLDKNRWNSLEDMLLEDSTKGMVKSGVVKIKIPGTFSLSNTRLSSGKFWIRIAFDGQTDLNSKIKNVFVNAFRVKEKTQVEASGIEIEKESKVKKIELIGGNPNINSFGIYDLTIVSTSGDSEKDYYTRSSEILRHKNRASTTWDFERIILDQFPEIERVFVYSRSTFPDKLLKGTSLQIVVIPKSESLGHATNRRVPYELLGRVKEHLLSKTSSFARFEVSNPVFEKLKVRCSVKFTNEFQLQSGYYRDKLNKELRTFLSSSSTYNRNNTENFYSISKSEILNFIEGRDYIDFVTQLSVLQLVEVQGAFNVIDTAIKYHGKNLEILRTISPYAVLISADTHQINPITDQTILDPEYASIGDLSIDSDFVVIERT